jgi:uncharacterized protein (TIRG00374 family)
LSGSSPRLIDRFGRRRLSLFVRLAVSAGALAWLAFAFDWPKLARHLASVRWSTVGASLAIFMVCVIPCSVRWRQILSACDYPVTLRESGWAYFVGSFFNACLPTGRGGDVVRALVVARKRHYPAGGVMTTVVVERTIGAFVALCFVMGAAPFVLPQVKAFGSALLSVSVLASCIVAFAAIATSSPVLKAIRKIVAMKADTRLGAIASDVLHVLGVVRSDRSLIAAQAGLSFVNQLALVLAGLVLAKAIPGFSVPWTAFLVVVPLVFFAGVLPSIGGYGVREVGYIVAWSWFGIGNEAAGVYALLQLLFLWCLALIGALLFAMGDADTRVTRAEMPAVASDRPAAADAGQQSRA